MPFCRSIFSPKPKDRRDTSGRYYDRKLKKIQFCTPRLRPVTRNMTRLPASIVVLGDVWARLGQEFVDHYLAGHQAQENDTGFWERQRKYRWIAMPSVDPSDYPCYPGAVILQNEPDGANIFLRRPRAAFFVGEVQDFFPPDKATTHMPDIRTVTLPCELGEHRCVFRGRWTRRVAIITAAGLQWVELSVRSKINPSNHGRDIIDPRETFINIENFDFTGIDPTKCYVVNRVLMAQYIRLEFSGDGDVYFEKTLDAPTPLCFQAFKVHAKETPDEGTHDGGIERVCMLKKMPRIKLRGKRFIANFINSFIPNQAKLGDEGGDSPQTSRWEEPSTLQSLRINFLSPKGKVQDVACHYFKCEMQLRGIVGILGHTLQDPDQIRNHPLSIRAMQLRALRQHIQVDGADDIDEDDSDTDDIDADDNDAHNIEAEDNASGNADDSTHESENEADIDSLMHGDRLVRNGISIHEDRADIDSIDSVDSLDDLPQLDPSNPEQRADDVYVNDVAEQRMFRDFLDDLVRQWNGDREAERRSNHDD